MSVSLAVDDHVALITIDRPDALNALDIDALQALRRCLVAFRDRDDLRVAILTGSGTRAFCTGSDLKGTRIDPLRPGATYPEAMFRSLEASSTMGLYIRLMDFNDLGLWKPMVAAINGHCLGGGLELALQCDLRIASTTATFGLTEARVGSIPAVSGIHRLLKSVPSAHAMKMMLTGERIDAARAAAIGLVSDVCAPERLIEDARALARTVAGNGPLAIQAVKRLSRQTHLSDADAQQLTELHWGALRDTADRTEGRAAFAEKRPPKFVGR